jgi:hypothetical protein
MPKKAPAPPPPAEPKARKPRKGVVPAMITGEVPVVKSVVSMDPDHVATTDVDD